MRLALLLCAALAPACIEEKIFDPGAGGDSGPPDGATGGDGAPGADARPDAPGCAPVNASCALPGDCCSGFCDPTGECQQTFDCLEADVACTAGVECCSGRCGRAGTDGSACQPSTGACVVNGQECATAAECCSLGCHAGLCGPPVCLAEGESCNQSADCCSNSCDPTLNRCAGQSGSCLPAGEACGPGTTGDCCSGLCVDFPDVAIAPMRCAAGGTCRVEGEICTADEDCCNDVCVGGRCVVDSGSCGIVGEACLANADCCSGACADDGTGFRSCQAVSGCRPHGEACTSDSECCSAPVDPAGDGCQIFFPGSPLGRCSDPGGCAYDGELCSGATMPCCNNFSCQLTAIGVSRCVANDLTGCRAEGASCAVAEECCSGVCAQVGSGILVCSASCRARDETCTTHADCCEGYCQPGAGPFLTSVCAIPPLCTPLGVACTSQLDCCNDVCGTFGGVAVCALSVP